MCRCMRYTGVFDISVHICQYTLRRVCTCARVCAVCALALGDKSVSAKFQLVDVGHLLLAWGVILSDSEDGVLSVFSLFLMGVQCMCV